MPIRAHGRGWQVRVQVRGRRIVQTVVGTKAQAKAVEARIRADIAANLAGQRAPHTFADAITRWPAVGQWRAKLTRVAGHPPHRSVELAASEPVAVVERRFLDSVDVDGRIARPDES